MSLLSVDSFTTKHFDLKQAWYWLGLKGYVLKRFIMLFEAIIA